MNCTSSNPAFSRLCIAPLALLLLAVVDAALLAGCKPENSRNPPPVKHWETRFPIKLGGKTIRAQISVTELETSQGLTGRNALAADEGMLFVFTEARQRYFWMPGVPINDDLGYFTDNGRLDEIAHLQAENRNEVPSRSDAIRYVLEMRENWFKENNITPGAKLDFQSVRAALEQRGFRPENYLP